MSLLPPLVLIFMVFGFLFFLALSIAFLLPNHYYPWGSFYLEFSAFVALFLSLFYLTARRKSFFSIPINFCFLLFALVPVAQLLFGKIFFFGDSVLAFFYLASFFIALNASFSFNFGDAHQKNLDAMALVLVAIGIVSTMIALIQWLMLWLTTLIHSLPIGARPYANLAQPNNYSSLIWISLFSLYYLFERNRIGIVGLLFAGLFLVAGAALAQSRTSWVVFSVLLVAVSIHGAISLRSSWRRLAMPLLVMTAFYVLSLVLSGLKEFLFGGSGQALRTEFTDIRTDMWMAFGAAILERPWFGYGWGQVSLAQLAVADLYPAVGLTQYSHNLFLDLLIWNGIPLGLVFIVLISLFWLRIFFVAKSEKGFYSLCCFSALLVHALLEYPHAYSYFLLLAGYFIGISAFDKVDIHQFRNFGNRWSSLISLLNSCVARFIIIPRYVLVFFVFFYAIALVFVWLDYRILEEDHRLLRFEAASIGTLKAEQKAPDVILFDQLQSFTWVARTTVFDDLTIEEQERMEKVAKRYSLPMPLLKLAQLQMAQGKPEQAFTTLKTIEHLYGKDTYNAAAEELQKTIPNEH